MPNSFYINFIFIQFLEGLGEPTPSINDELVNLSTTEFKENLHAIVKQIKRETMVTFAAAKSKKEFTAYLSGLKKMVFISDDYIFQFLSKEHETLASVIPKRLKYIQQVLDEFLEFLDENFSAFVNPNDKISRTQFKEEKSKINVILELVSSWPYGYSKLKSIQLLIRPLCCFTEQEKSCRYKELSYVHSIGQAINRLELIPNKSAFEAKIIALLFQLNVNSPRTFLQLTNTYKYTLQSKGTLEDKLIYLLEILKTISAYPKVKEGSYKENHLSLTYQIEDWVHSEIGFIESQRRLNEKESSVPVVGKTVESKLKLNLSVSEIAALLKSFNDAELTKGNNITQLLKWASKNMSSKNQENISFESLRSKYYDIPFSTKERIIVAFRKVLKAVHKG